MNRETVESSFIRSVGYDPTSRMLEVEFKAGRIYQYVDVDPETAQKFLESASKGKFFGQHISGRFGHRRADKVEEAEPEAPPAAA